MKFIFGVIVGILIVIAVPAAMILTGNFSMSATSKPTLMEQKAGSWAWLQSAKKNAPKVKNPSIDDPSALDEGLDHYKENCVVCHGAPGVESGEIGKGLNPPAPVLDLPVVQQLTDGELFWTIKNGIRMSGMPAFGPTHLDDEIWSIVTFVRHLPQLTEKEKAELREATEEKEHHHEAENEAEHAAPHTHTHQHKPAH